jgi:uncharacterized protein
LWQVPALFDRPLAAADWAFHCVSNFAERQVRQMVAVRDVNRFHRSMHLCAARSGHLLNLTALGLG